MTSGSQPAGQGQQWGSLPRTGPVSPVPVSETRTTPRRVVQYVIDDVLAGLIPGLIWWIVSLGHSGFVHAIGWVIAAAVWVLIMIWYWVLRPFGHGGQTFGMKLLGLRIVSKDGDRANRTQLVIRWLLLIVDTLFLGLLGLITMLCSLYRQRVGDHVARTLVVRASWRTEPDEHVFAESMHR
jgi:uncharacterized RDD family membrane protein YckC